MLAQKGIVLNIDAKSDEDGEHACAIYSFAVLILDVCKVFFIPTFWGRKCASAHYI